MIEQEVKSIKDISKELVTEYVYYIRDMYSKGDARLKNFDNSLIAYQNLFLETFAYSFKLDLQRAYIEDTSLLEEISIHLHKVKIKEGYRKVILEQPLVVYNTCLKLFEMVLDGVMQDGK